MHNYWTSTSVELHWRSVYSDADSTQLDVELSTRSQREQLSLISSEHRDPVRVSIETRRRNTTRRQVWVKPRRYKRTLRCCWWLFCCRYLTRPSGPYCHRKLPHGPYGSALCCDIYLTTLRLWLCDDQSSMCVLRIYFELVLIPCWSLACSVRPPLSSVFAIYAVQRYA